MNRKKAILKPIPVSFLNTTIKQVTYDKASDCKMIEVIKAEIRIKETKVQTLAEMIDSLEQKINDQAEREGDAQTCYKVFGDNNNELMHPYCPLCGDWLGERYLVRNNETEFHCFTCGHTEFNQQT